MGWSRKACGFQQPAHLTLERPKAAVDAQPRESRQDQWIPLRESLGQGVGPDKAKYRDSDVTIRSPCLKDKFFELPRRSKQGMWLTLWGAGSVRGLRLGRQVVTGQGSCNRSYASGNQALQMLWFQTT